MFSSRSGWLAVVIAIVGALTAADTMPIVTAFAHSVGGAKAAQLTGGLLAIAAALVAKLAHPAPASVPAEPATRE